MQQPIHPCFHHLWSHCSNWGWFNRLFGSEPWVVMSKMTRHSVFRFIQGILIEYLLCAWAAAREQSSHRFSLTEAECDGRQMLTNHTTKLVIINRVNARKEKHKVLWEYVIVSLDHICSFPWNFLSPLPLPNILARYLEVSWLPSSVPYPARPTRYQIYLQSIFIALLFPSLLSFTLSFSPT